MVEVFKTDVTNPRHAALLVGLIQRTFVGYSVNFDLEDCDRVLRIENSGPVQASGVVELMHDFGFDAQVLADTIEPDDKLGESIDRYTLSKA